MIAQGGTVAGDQGPHYRYLPLCKETHLDVYEWSRSAEPGQRLVYATGPMEFRGGQTQQTMSSAMRAHMQGLVFLAQKMRRADDCWDYVAIRISRNTAKSLGLIDNPDRLHKPKQAADFFPSSLRSV